MADIFGFDSQIEIDQTETTRSSWAGVVVGGVLVAISGVLVAFGMNPAAYISENGAAIEGNQIWNWTGWVLGAIVVPIVVVLAHQQELRRSLNPNHIRKGQIKNLLACVLFSGLTVSALHAFLGSVTIQFGK